MKIIVTKLGTSTAGGEGRVDFYRGDAVIHSEEFSGMVQAGKYTRLIDVPADARAVFVPVVGNFEGRIEE